MIVLLAKNDLPGLTIEASKYAARQVYMSLVEPS
jgi:hypothetical protein